MENNNKNNELMLVFAKEFGLTVNEQGNVVVNSRTIAEKYGKEHKHIMRDIRNLIKLSNELKDNFIKSVYVNKNNRKMPEYKINETGLKILTSTYKYGKQLNCDNDYITYYVRPEYNFLKILKDMFPKSNIQSQMPILNYRVDYYIPEGRIIVEYDEEPHKYNIEKDEIRILEIKKEIMKRIIDGVPIFLGEEDCCANLWLKDKDITHVVRIEKGNEFKGLNEILNIMWQESIIDHVI